MDILETWPSTKLLNQRANILLSQPLSVKMWLNQSALDVNYKWVFCLKFGIQHGCFVNYGQMLWLRSAGNGPQL